MYPHTYKLKMAASCCLVPVNCRDISPSALVDVERDHLLANNSSGIDRVEGKTASTNPIVEMRSFARIKCQYTLSFLYSTSGRLTK